MKRIVIIGASGHGKVVADIAKYNGYESIVFLDDDITLKECAGYKVVGITNQYDEYDGDFIVAIGNSKIRQLIVQKLENAGKNLPVLVHPDAVVADSVTIGNGTVIMAGAVVNPDVVIGEGCIINTCASVDHDCRINDYVHVSVGAHIAGTVNVASHTWIGIGATISNNINICRDCVIGAGAVVIKEIDKPGTYVGIPAKSIERN